MENIQIVNCVALEKLKQLITDKKQEVKIIDVRAREEFDQQHIPGAINISISELELVNKLFDKADIIITACGKGGGRSTQAAEKLNEMGFKNSNWLCGGTFGWYEKPIQ
ncbi:MAG: rhodanese-like domain-containing protein [Bacteroidota bacterium]|nr:rhodanese-like domain-containing protein [Bacteroidota bacterium]